MPCTYVCDVVKWGYALHQYHYAVMFVGGQKLHLLDYMYTKVINFFLSAVEVPIIQLCILHKNS